MLAISAAILNSWAFSSAEKGGGGGRGRGVSIFLGKLSNDAQNNKQGVTLASASVFHAADALFRGTSVQTILRALLIPIREKG